MGSILLQCFKRARAIPFVLMYCNGYHFRAMNFPTNFMLERTLRDNIYNPNASFVMT